MNFSEAMSYENYLTPDFHTINPRYQDDTRVWAKISLLSQAETADR